MSLRIIISQRDEVERRYLIDAGHLHIRLIGLEEIALAHRRNAQRDIT